MPWFWNKDIPNDNNAFYVRNKERKLFVILTAGFSDVLLLIIFADVIVYIIPY